MSPGGADSVAFGFGPMLLPGDRPPVDFFVPLLLHALVRSRTGMNAAAIQALRCRWGHGGIPSSSCAAQALGLLRR